MKNYFYFCFILFALTSCAGSPIRVATMSSEDLKSQSLETLCEAYGRQWISKWVTGQINKKSKIRAEIIRRNVFTKEEMELIDQFKVEVGMSEMGVWCSLGKPLKVNEENDGGNIKKEFVYKIYDPYDLQNDPIFIYVEKEKVSSIVYELYNGENG